MISLLTQLKTVCEHTIVALMALLSLYAPQFGGLGDILPTATIGNTMFTFSWTDENIGEDFIIRSDEKDYYSFGTAVIHFSITNNSNQDQNTVVAVTAKDDVIVKSIKRLIRNDIVQGMIIPASVDAFGSSTPELIIPDVNVPVWETGVMIKSSNASLKSVKGLTNKSGASFLIQKGETAYFEAAIKFIGAGEFFIEAFGNKGGYGHLDPNNWVFEDKMNSDTKSVASLNGQDGWVVTGCDWAAQTTDKYEGDQGATTGSHTRLGCYLANTFSTIADGTVYLAVMREASVGSTDVYWDIKNGAGYVTRVSHRDDGAGNKTILYENSAHALVQFDTFSSATWGVIKVIFDCAADTANYQWYNGSSWGTATGNVATAYTCDTASGIKFFSDWNSGVGTQDDSVDTITPTDPTVSPVTIIPSVGEFFIYDM